MRENDETTLDIARTDYNTAVILLNNLSGDERELNIIAYHLQQALEKTMKYILECRGAPTKLTHNLVSIYTKNKDLFSDMPENLVERLEMLTMWESQTRYICGYRTEKIIIDKMLLLVYDYMNIVSDKNKITTTHLFD